ncbi:hypothetical protein BAAM0483_09185 [Bifidobacterium animalis subsp. animalis MCC 0483]|uniref:DNA alkylation repair protein n=1 Tax=Bifidobacterium animalis subsp. animalis MCC 0483 TaxID=1365955 RepID=A0AB34T6U2_9BIFI|nr:DNA alkylation repair protein [Bifidobacterium animalis]KOA47836.1 hypothetical protein BAAM0483_09185 [Bifidobacterium animalis subsp. animalis MCC 0483]
MTGPFFSAPGPFRQGGAHAHHDCRHGEGPRASGIPLAAPDYKAFNAKLIPNIDPATMLGVRMPQLRALVKQLRRGGLRVLGEFLDDLPHRRFGENMLHAILIADLHPSITETIAALSRFLPYADNWAVTDTIRVPPLSDADARIWLDQLERWMHVDHPYTVRYAAVALMTDFLDERFAAAQLRLVEAIRRDDYYVNMARTWYFATALAKQWEDTLLLLEQRRLDAWTHNKTIQKTCESYRVPAEHKTLLRSLRLPRVQNTL